MVIPDSYKIALKNERSFARISDSDGEYYGGHQQWLSDYGFSSQSYADSACGVVAASNMFYYMSKYVPGKSGLCSEANMDKAGFTAFVNKVCKYVMPSGMGIPFVRMLQSGIIAYADSNGVGLTCHVLTSWGKESTINFIQDGLRHNSPVLMVTWNSTIPDLVWHWVTITKVYRDSGRSNMLVTSNWGERKAYNFDRWHDDAWSLHRGLLYFT
jgi:hypothetical protein